MNNKNDSNNPKDKQQVTQKEDLYQYSETGVYLRDDHCDWGSSGMSEYTCLLYTSPSPRDRG